MERYISPAGNDSNAGTLASPWRTLAGAAARMAAGDTIRAAAGEYYGGSFAGSKPFHLRVMEGAEVRVARRDRPQALSLDTWSDGSLDGEGGRLIIGPCQAPASTSDSATSSCAIQLPGSRNVAVRRLVAESGADVGVLLNRNAAGRAADSILLEDVEAVGNGEGIRVNGYGSSSASGAGAGVVIRRAHTHHNQRMVVAAASGSYGAVGVVLDKCYGVRVYDLLSHDNVAPNPEQYGLDGGALEIFGAQGCTIDGLEAYGNEGVLETGGTSSTPTPEGNELRNFRITGPIHQGGADSPVFLLRASRGMLIESGLIDVTGPGDVFRWAADSWGGDWSGSTLRDILVRAPGATVFQSYGQPLEGVTISNVAEYADVAEALLTASLRSEALLAASRSLLEDAQAVQRDLEQALTLARRALQ